MPVPTSPRWGLILFLLVLDVGLAGAGALLLQKGLAKPAAATEKLEPKAAPARAASAGSAAPVTATAPQTGLAASVTAIAQTAPAATAPAPVPPAPQVIEKRPVAKAKGGSPENPYDAKSSLPGEVELAAARSKDDLAKCQTAEEGPPHGRIDIAFTIERDGSVSRVNATKDTTGSRTLARRARELPVFLGSLATVIGGGLVCVPGGVLIRDADGAIIGAVGISGDTGDNDERAAVAGIDAAGLAADPGSD